MYSDRQKYDAAYPLHIALERVRQEKKLVYHVASVSAESLPELQSAATSPLVISGRYSDQTMFGDPADNWLQRAHHDSWHLALHADTSLHGERRVATAQCADIERLAGRTMADLVWADIFGQTLYYETFQGFPVDQAAFVYHYRTTGELLAF
jgi:pyruvate-formate lyase-activating enzyme